MTLRYFNVSLCQGGLPGTPRRRLWRCCLWPARSVSAGGMGCGREARASRSVVGRNAQCRLEHGANSPRTSSSANSPTATPRRRVSRICPSVTPGLRACMTGDGWRQKSQLSRAHPRLRDGSEPVAEVGKAVAAGLKAIEAVRDEIAIKVGLARGWVNQPRELVAERDIVLTAFAAGSEPGIEFRAGGACLRRWMIPCSDWRRSPPTARAIKSYRSRPRRNPGAAQVSTALVMISWKSALRALTVTLRFILKAKPITLAGDVAVHDKVVHRLALPILRDRHARDETGLRERGFLLEQRSCFDSRAAAKDGEPGRTCLRLSPGRPGAARPLLKKDAATPAGRHAPIGPGTGFRRPD